MIATSFPEKGACEAHRVEGEENAMHSVSSGTLGGAGSFRCQRCGYVLTLAGSDRLTDCPGCGGREFVRASLFRTERIHGAAPGIPEGALSGPAPAGSARQP